MPAVASRDAEVNADKKKGEEDKGNENETGEGGGGRKTDANRFSKNIIANSNLK